MFYANKEVKKTLVRSAIGSPSAIGLLKFFKETGFNIIGTDIENLSVGNLFVNGFYKVPKAASEKEVIEVYINIIEKEKASWIISGPEEEILVLARHRKIFEIMGTFIFHPPIEEGVLNLVEM